MNFLDNESQEKDIEKEKENNIKLIKVDEK